jgi:DNA repair exonuclease SbcCD ATPase subunit
VPDLRPPARERLHFVREALQGRGRRREEGRRRRRRDGQEGPGRSCARREGTGRCCGRGRASTRAGRSANPARRAGRWPHGRDREPAEPFEGAVPSSTSCARAPSARTLAARATELGAQRQHLDQAERDLAAARTRIDKLDAELARLAGEAEGLAFDEAQHARLRDEREHAAGALEEARSAERGASDALKDAEKAEAELLAALRQAKETQAKVDELRSEARYVERVAMLLEGFRDHLVARVGPELSREAEALFRELTNHEYDDLKVDEEKLTIQIADGDSYFAIDRFSGSETDLANLALRVAISTQLSRLSGADVGMMVLDEVLASLDEERKDLMVQALGRLSSRFHQLFVVTHAEQVKDQFPASILVQKVGRRRSTAVLV